MALVVRETQLFLHGEPLCGESLVDVKQLHEDEPKPWTISAGYKDLTSSLS
jgi:hypothetical protein